MSQLVCPTCGSPEAWNLRRGKMKCRACRKEYSGYAYPVPSFRATLGDWKRCIRAFIRDRTILGVMEQTNLSQYMVERMLMHLRIRMADVVPPVFQGPLEMDETYIGGQRKNKRLHIRRIKGKRGHGTDKLPIFGIFDRTTRMVFVAVEPKKLDLQFIIRTLKERARPHTKIYTDGFKMYRGLSNHGFRHFFVDHDADELVRGNIHTNNMEGFWGILKRKMGCIGGMRRKYLYLFVAEIVWKFNHRKLTPREQEKTLLELILT